MAKLTLLCVALLAVASCAKESNIEQLHAAARATVATTSYTVTASSSQFGQKTDELIAEKYGNRVRVVAGNVVEGIFLDNAAYLADATDPSVFMRCSPRRKDGSRRTFDKWLPPLRAAARAKSVVRRRDVFTFETLMTTSTERTKAEFTLGGGRVKTMTVTGFTTGTHLEPPITVTYRFDYRRLPAITAPPQDAIEDAAAC